MRRELVFFFAVCLAGCGDTAGPALQIDLQLSPTPPTMGPARLIVGLTDSVGLPVEGIPVQVFGTPEGGPPTASVPAREQGQGRYVVPEFHFAAAGPWTVTVHAKTRGGLDVTREFKTSVFGTSRVRAVPDTTDP